MQDEFHSDPGKISANYGLWSISLELSKLLIFVQFPDELFAILQIFRNQAPWNSTDFSILVRRLCQCGCLCKRIIRVGFLPNIFQSIIFDMLSYFGDYFFLKILKIGFFYVSNVEKFYFFFLKRFSFSKYFPNFSLFQCRSFPQILCAYTNWRFCQIWLWKQKGVHGRSNSIRPQNSKGSVKLEKKFLIFYFSVEEIFCHFVGAPGSWQGISHGFEYQKRGWKFLK